MKYSKFIFSIGLIIIFSSFIASATHSFVIDSVDYNPNFNTGDPVQINIIVTNNGYKDQAHVRVKYPNENFGPSYEKKQTSYINSGESKTFDFEFTLNHEENVSGTVYVSDVFYSDSVTEDFLFIYQAIEEDEDAEDNTSENQDENEENAVDQNYFDDENTGGDETPGFELIAVLIAFVLILFFKRKRI